MTTVLIKDSIEHISNDFSKSNNIERKGKLFKGLVNTQVSVPTIPSKYLTVITDNNEQKGFHRSSKRFQLNCPDTPGPGSYNCVVNIETKIKKTSDSKKGYGGFASSSSRIDSKFNPDYTPGAGTYHTENNILFKKKDFSSGYSSVFQKPIAVKIEKESEIPAPNQYDVTKSNRQKLKSNNVCADSAFKSLTKRDVFSDDRVNVPAPGAYNINDELTHESAKIPCSIFKSNVQRRTFTPNTNVPGPSDYKPYEPVLDDVVRQLFPRRHYLAISAPAVPMAPELPLPGPGTYDVRDFKDIEKKYMSSAVFVSSTGRGIHNNLNYSNMPGPANYTPVKLAKNSFHYNYERKWI